MAKYLSVNKDSQGRFMLKRFIAIIVVILIAGGGFWFYHEHALHQPKPPARAPTTVTVGISTAKMESWPVEIVTTGDMTSVKGVTVSAEIAGRVTDIFVKSGQEVKAGQKLFQINPATLEADLKAANAELKLAKEKLSQQKGIFDTGYNSKVALQTAEKDYRDSVAAVSKAKAQLDLTLVRAPADGRVGLRLIEKGDYVNVDDPLTHLDAKSALRINFSVPARFLQAIKLEQTVIFHTNAHPDKTFTATVYAINSRIAPETNSIRVRALLQNPSENHISGVFGQVRLEITQGKPTLVIPKTAVIYDIAGANVYRVVDGKAQSTDIKTGIHRGDFVSVTHGLKAGDEVVSSGQIKIHSGSLVKALSQTGHAS
jgi:membrane fusion protein, multidrug efflux system